MSKIQVDPTLRGRAAALQAIACIEADPESWDQSRWHCGTTCCFAGHLAVNAGYGWLSDRGTEMEGPDGGRVRFAPDVALEILGLDLDDDSAASWDRMGDMENLFEGANTLEDIKEGVDALFPEVVRS